MCKQHISFQVLDSHVCLVAAVFNSTALSMNCTRLALSWEKGVNLCNLLYFSQLLAISYPQRVGWSGLEGAVASVWLRAFLWGKCRLWVLPGGRWVYLPWRGPGYSAKYSLHCSCTLVLTLHSFNAGSDSLGFQLATFSGKTVKWGLMAPRVAPAAELVPTLWLKPKGSNQLQQTFMSWTKEMHLSWVDRVEPGIEFFLTREPDASVSEQNHFQCNPGVAEKRDPKGSRNEEVLNMVNGVGMIVLQVRLRDRIANVANVSTLQQAGMFHMWPHWRKRKDHYPKFGPDVKSVDTINMQRKYKCLLLTKWGFLVRGAEWLEGAGKGGWGFCCD